MSSISKWNWFLISDKHVYFSSEIDGIYTTERRNRSLDCRKPPINEKVHRINGRPCRLARKYTIPGTIIICSTNIKPVKGSANKLCLIPTLQLS